MNKNDILKMLGKAFMHKNKAQMLLTEAVRETAKAKGFKNHELFECSFASGNETVVCFNQDFEMANLDLKEMMEMSFDEIIDKFSSWYLKYDEASMELLKERGGEE